MGGFEYGAPAPYPSGIVKGYGSQTSTTLTEVIARPGVGQALMISCLFLNNAHATTKGEVDLYSGSTKLIGPLPVPAAGGAIACPLNPPLPCNENEAFNFKPIAGVTTLSVSAIGYIAKSGQTG